MLFLQYFFFFITITTAVLELQKTPFAICFVITNRKTICSLREPFSDLHLKMFVTTHFIAN